MKEITNVLPKQKDSVSQTPRDLSEQEIKSLRQDKKDSIAQSMELFKDVKPL
ncbi:MAG: hypothetical protein Ta2F_18730 [Termitinemataceae bacterium]|nr:MAG: hypothetical protein Ta2F_18730 [Termitinemataceae bacterium]